MHERSTSDGSSSSGTLPNGKFFIITKDLKGMKSFSFRSKNYYVIVLDNSLQKPYAIENIEWYINQLNGSLEVSGT